MNSFDHSGEPTTKEMVWYLVDWMDEVLVHEPTKEGCATFLHEGSEVDEIDPPGVPGEVYKLAVLNLYEDATARRNGEGGWELDPPEAGQATFAALRMAPGEGWQADSKFDPQHINDGWGNDLLNDVAGDGDEVANIANGRFWYFTARFEVVGDVPQLVLIEEVTESEAAS